MHRSDPRALREGSSEEEDELLSLLFSLESTVGGDPAFDWNYCLDRLRVMAEDYELFDDSKWPDGAGVARKAWAKLAAKAFKGAQREMDRVRRELEQRGRVLSRFQKTFRGNYRV